MNEERYNSFLRKNVKKYRLTVSLGTVAGDTEQRLYYRDTYTAAHWFDNKSFTITAPVDGLSPFWLASEVRRAIVETNRELFGELVTHVDSAGQIWIYDKYSKLFPIVVTLSEPTE